MQIQPKSRAVLNEQGIIEVTWGPLIDLNTYLEVAGQMMALITGQQDKRIDPLMLIDFTHLEAITPDAASLATSATRDLGCRKIAGFGIKPIAKGFLDVIKHGSTQANSIGEFPTREEAMAWLLE